MGSDSPKEQVENWFTKYTGHPVMFGTFYNPDKVLFKVNSHHGYVLRQLIELYLNDELNEFVVLDFCNTSKEVGIKSYRSGPYGHMKFDVAEVISMMDKHLLNLNEIIVYDYDFDGEYNAAKIKRYGSGDWRVEPD